MNYFLNKCANYIFNNHNINELADICIVLPSRRGVYFIKEEFAKLTHIPIISPKIVAVEDFILEQTKLQVLEPIDLYIELFAAYKTIDNNVQFDRFMTWAPTLLKDFESIDQYLINAKQLFAFMTEAKAMERWNIEAYHAQKSIFETSVEKYFELFNRLAEVYQKFNQSLLEKNKAYRGSAYRYLAENIEAKMAEFTKKKYYFVGFNALSISEKKILKTLIEHKKAETLWDSDGFYMEKTSSFQLAGQFLKELKADQTVSGNWHWQENLLLEQPKNIKIIGLPHASMQAKIASYYLEEWYENQQKNISTAVILGDESLLTTLTSQIPKSIGNYNITMGISLKSSPIFTLLKLLFELQDSPKNNQTLSPSKLNSRLIIKVLNNTLVKQLATQFQINCMEIVKNISSDNLLYMSVRELENYLGNSEFYSILFTSWNDSPNIATEKLKQLLILLDNFQQNIGNEIEKEFIFHYLKNLNKARTIIDQNNETFNVAGLKSLMFEIFKQSKLPFESNLRNNLQIMGMLETRTLDFDRIIILSANEGVLPSSSKAKSLIPFDALKELGMPTYSHQDAIMAYHFFRLLQRAKEVVILYTEPSGSYGTNQKSRFILQIEHELAPRNLNINIEYPKFNFIEKDHNQFTNTDLSLEKKIPEYTIEKTDEIVENIKNSLKTKGLSATYMNEYIRCKMLFYLNRIIKLEEPDEIDESIASDTFGTWVHKTLENIDRNFLIKGGIVHKESLTEIIKTIKSRLIADFENIGKNVSLNEGMNLVLLNVAEKILVGYFENEINMGEFPQTIIGIEKEFNIENKIIINGELISINIKGKIDKIDKIGQKIRVIDYKTGKVNKGKLTFNHKIKSLEKIDNILNNSELDKIRQLWLYKYLYLKSLESDSSLRQNTFQLETGMYSFRKNKDGFMTGFKYFTEESETDQEFIQTSEQIIQEFVESLFDKNKPFSRTENLKSCMYCSYRGVCNR